MGKISDSPCLGCSDRVAEPNCHMTCEKYLAFQQFRTKKIEAVHSNSEWNDYNRKLGNRIEKRRKKHVVFRNTMD